MNFIRVKELTRIQENLEIAADLVDDLWGEGLISDAENSILSVRLEEIETEILREKKAFAKKVMSKDKEAFMLKRNKEKNYEQRKYK